MAGWGGEGAAGTGGEGGGGGAPSSPVLLSREAVDGAGSLTCELSISSLTL